MRYDVVTFGETMLRLTPPNLLRIEQTNSYNAMIGGSESNMAVGLSRLGLHVAWLSRLTDNSIGRFITSEIQRHNVDVSHVIWTDEDRVGLFFLEEGRQPRTSRVIYDRAHSAMARIRPEHIDPNFFREHPTRILHLSGITPALSDSALETTFYMIQQAQENDVKISFDLNYRSKLWTPEEARETFEEIIPHVDILFVTLSDVKNVLGTDDAEQPIEILTQLAKRYPKTMILMTMGKEGVLGYSRTGAIFEEQAFSTETVDRVGGGDAFVAGFLYGYLVPHDAETRFGYALRCGTATAALKYSIVGDMALVDSEEVRHLVEMGDEDRDIRR